MSSNLKNGYDAKPNNSGRSSRNRTLIKNGIAQPKPFSNGNTVVGLIYSKGVILGADTRANLGNLLISQTAEKIHRLHNLIYTAGAGISRDLQQTARITASRLEMIASNSNTLYPRVRCANRMIKRHLFRYRGGIMANFLVAGVDRSGSELYCTDMDGYSKKVSYAALGSGGLAATSVLKSGWRPNLKEKDAYDLVCDAVVAGIQNDVGSATKVDMCILRKNFTQKQQQQTVQLHCRGDKTTDCRDIQQTDLRNIDVVEERVYLPPPLSMDNFFFGPWTGSIFEQQDTSSSAADDEQQETSSSTAEGEQQDDDNKNISSILEN